LNGEIAMPAKPGSKTKFEQIPLEKLRRLLPPDELSSKPENPVNKRSSEKREPYSITPSKVK
jgi:hypothetical protein